MIYAYKFFLSFPDFKRPKRRQLDKYLKKKVLDLDGFQYIGFDGEKFWFDCVKYPDVRANEMLAKRMMKVLTEAIESRKEYGYEVKKPVLK